MKKKLLLKYIEGNATPEEERLIVEWSNKSPENRAYLIELNKLWLATNMPREELSHEELSLIKKKIALKRSKKRLRRYSYAAVSLLVVSLLINISTLNKRKRESPPLLTTIDIEEHTPPQESETVTIYTTNGVKGSITLPDSSVVWLNSASKISYPAQFDDKQRIVKLSGEAYFKVKKNRDVPMIVYTDKEFYVEVLGTEFNLKAYSDEPTSEAILYSGKIKIHPNYKEEHATPTIALKPMEKIVIEKSTLETSLSEVRTKEATEWINGVLRFKNTPLSQVVQSLERWHGVKVVVADKSLLNYRITATFKSQSAIQIMDMIRYITPINYHLEGETITLTPRYYLSN